MSHTLTGLALAPGASLWVRWSDFEASGSDDGLAIDDFSVRGLASVVQAVPETMSTGLMGALLTALLFGRRRGRTADACQT